MSSLASSCECNHLGACLPCNAATVVLQDCLSMSMSAALKSPYAAGSLRTNILGSSFIVRTHLRCQASRACGRAFHRAPSIMLLLLWTRSGSIPERVFKDQPFNNIGLDVHLDVHSGTTS